MDNLTDFQIDGRIHESQLVHLFYGRKPGSRQRCIIQRFQPMKGLTISAADIIQRFEKIKSVNVNSYLKISEILMTDDEQVIVIYDYFEGKLLETILEPEPLDFKVALGIGLALAEAIAHLHKNNLIHQSIRPDNILVNPAEMTVKLILSDILAISPADSKSYSYHEILNYILPYLSPEQSGRIKDTVDYHSDMYSVGILLYRMLTGLLPFQFDNPMEIIHAHIARTPKPPCEVNPAIPKVLSDIIMKLLSKSIEKRYRSMFGLMEDLNECLLRLEMTGEIPFFEPATKDMPLSFSLPLRMIGRDEEIRQLLAIFKNVQQGKREMLFVSGPPGIGKSTLINELHSTVVAQHAYFCWGKYEKIGQDIPYSAIIYAFRRLVRLILSESKEKIEIFKKRLQKNLGDYGRIVTNIFPDVGLIIGEQAPIPPLGALESQNRFNLVFKNFIKAFAKAEHPLVLFLDDLHWSDSASLDLMKMLLLDTEIKYLFFIGIYRDNEMSSDHRLYRMRNDIEKSTLKINELVLSHLEVNHFNFLISEFLQCTPETSLTLAKLVYRKTNGNPFFFNQFMKTLVDRKLLYLEPSLGWQWDTVRIHEMQDTENVADLMIYKFRQLDPNMNSLLATCACLGRRFKTDLLPKVLDTPYERILSDLSRVSQQGFISTSDDYYLFNHDRIHETIYYFMPDAEREALHLKIGRIASADLYHKNIRPADLFFIVNQLNLGKKLISEIKERQFVARLNLEAGRKAKESAAYSLAWDYLKTATELIDKDSWQKQYDFTLALYLETVEAAYLATAFEEMEHLGTIVLKRARDVLDKITVFDIIIKTYLSQNKSAKAFHLGLDCLTQLGLHFPRKPNSSHLLFGFLKTHLAMLGKPIHTLAGMPKMTDPMHKAQIQIMSSVAPAVYWVKPNLLPLLAFKMVNMAITHGNSRLSPFNYAGFGLILCGLGFIDRGYQFGQLAIHLVEKNQLNDQYARTYMVFYAFIYHWKNHVQGTLEKLLRAYQKGIETGDFEFAAFSLNIYCFHAFYLSKSLDSFEADLLTHLHTLKRLKQETQLNLVHLIYQVVKNLKNQSRQPSFLDTDFSSEIPLSAVFVKSGDRTNIFSFYTLKLIHSYLFGRYQLALETADIAQKYAEVVISDLISPCFYFFEALACLAFYPEAAPLIKKKLLKRVSQTLRKMKRWSKHAPMNYAHQYHLIMAERHRVTGNDTKTVSAYMHAIQMAGQNNYTLHEAIANERLATYYMGVKQTSLGRYYLLEARKCYDQWGAGAKTQNIDRTYFKHFESSPKNYLAKKFGDFDYSSVVNSLQALSKEIVLTELLKILTKIMTENAGADKVLFISIVKDEIFVEAERHIGTNAGVPQEETIIQKTALESHRDLLIPAVYYVKRTAEYLLLEDAENLGDYTKDPYIVENRPKSILCLPIIRQAKLTGILYLENSSTRGVFTADRIEILKLLSSQIAISHENALLYENLTKADKALIESERKYRLLAENVTDNIWVWDFINEKFLYHSPSVKQTRGFSQEEAMKLSLKDTLPPSYYKKAVEVLAQELNNDEEVRLDPRRSLTMEMETYCKDGSTIVTEATMRFIRDENGHPTSILGVSRDITGRKKAEEKIKRLNIELENRVAQRTVELEKSLETLKNTQEQLIQSEKMAALGGLVAGVAHEINTPLSVGLTAATLLEEKTKAQKIRYEQNNLRRSDLEKYLSTALDASSLINNNLQRVAELVQSFKQVAVDQSTEQCRTFNVKDHIHELLISLRPKLKKTKHEVTVNCSDDIIIYSYPGFFYQILTNLIMNSLIHGFDNITTGRIVIESYLNHDHLILKYTDNGNGMEHTTLQKMYDPFFTTKRSQGGTGLGMHIVFNIITHSLQGQIDCRSKKGNGVHFCIKIPVTATSKEQIVG